MVREVLAADAGIAECIRVVSSAQDASVRDIVCKKIAEPVYAFRAVQVLSRCPFKAWMATILRETSAQVLPHTDQLTRRRG
jgi:hypothetical protein